jgi:hypothetical protein
MRFYKKYRCNVWNILHHGVIYKSGEHEEYYETYIDSVKVYQTAAVNCLMPMAAVSKQKICLLLLNMLIFCLRILINCLK